MSVTYNLRAEFSKDEILAALDEVSRPVEVAIWGSENHFNFGSSIRTCHNFLARRLWGIDLAHEKPYYKKAAMTALQYYKASIALCSSERFLDQTKGRNIVAFERREDIDGQDLRRFSYPDNPILLFGSEKFGIPDNLLERANHVVTIPNDGLVLDLNVATAVGIGLYDWLTKWSMK